MQDIALTINGEQITASVDPRMTLADFLRERLDVRSIHLGCEHGVCGGCTIIIDGMIGRSWVSSWRTKITAKSSPCSTSR